jgi:PAS domain S-box-containing protein
MRRQRFQKNCICPPDRGGGGNASAGRKEQLEHLPSFKATVALAAQQGGHSYAELAQRFGVTPEQVRQWQDGLIENAASAFSADAGLKSELQGLLDSKDVALTIAENSTQGLAMMDERGFCVYANRTWLQMTGYSSDEIRSLPLHELVHHHYPDGRPYPKAECPIDRALPEHFDVRAHEDLFFRKDGNSFSVMCAASPIFERGRPVATVIEIRDITEQKQIEDRERQAAETNAKFRTFFEQGWNFAGVMTLDGTLAEVNRAGMECGFAREDVIGKKFWECGWWSRSPALMEMVRAGTAEAVAGRPFRRETNYFTADGSEHMVDLALTPVTDDAGRVLFIALTGSDITERKRAEERLRLLDEMSEAIRSAGDTKTIIEIVTRLLGRHLGVSRCIYADFEAGDDDRFTIRHGWTAEGAASMVGAYSLNMFGQRMAADVREGRTLVIDDIDRELSQSESRHVYDALGIKAVLRCPLVKQGRLAAMIAVHQNRPRRWHAEETALVEQVLDRCWAHVERVRVTKELRASEAYLGSLFRQTAAGIAQTDLGGRILSVNDRFCAILHRDCGDLPGRSIHEYLHPDDLQRVMSLVERMIRSGEPFEVEKRFLLPDGSTIWVSTAVSLIRPGGGLDDIMLAVVFDITERKQAEEKLLEADRRKDEFLAMLAHELRNPLAPIGAAADLLRLEGVDPTRIKRSSEVISRQVRHMTGLVDDLLDVSRVTRGLISLDKQALDVKRIAADAVEQVRNYIEARHHHLELRTPQEAAFVRADKKRMVQVIANLLNNAAKYTAQGGRIVFDIALDDGWVKFSVEDNGIGMAPELVDRAFDLFTQAGRSADRSQGGLGIGLALVKSLVELHGGRVLASSGGLGLGSKFTVSLPRLREQAAHAAAPVDPVPDSVHGDGLRIMVVDDNIDAAGMLAMYLETLGHRVSVEHDPWCALERARTQTFDVCLLDIGLPGMDGNALARCLRAQPESARAVLIAVTGYGQEQDRRSARNAGFDHYFVKPVDASRLASLLNEVGAGSRPSS